MTTAHISAATQSNICIHITIILSQFAIHTVKYFQLTMNPIWTKAKEDNLITYHTHHSLTGETVSHQTDSFANNMRTLHVILIWEVICCAWILYFTYSLHNFGANMFRTVRISSGKPIIGSCVIYIQQIKLDFIGP